MPISEAAHELLDALDFHDRVALATRFAAHIRCTGSLSLTLERNHVLLILELCSRAFSDLRFNFSEAREAPGALRLRYALRATHDGPLDLAPLGVPLQIPPTGRILRLPSSAATFTFNAAGEVAGLELQFAAGAAPRDIIARLGAALPPAFTA